MHVEPWWRSAVIYQIYTRSFADSNGDGDGDLQGIRSKLGYLAALGVDGIWLSPFYPSPQIDGGYDVADYRDVDPMYGTLADFDELLSDAHAAGLKVLVDIVPNHTSDAHPWFRAALGSAPGSPERERYMFRDGRGPDGAEPPNNWAGSFGGGAWTRVTEADGTPGQWYLHSFAPAQPDLNWRNPAIREEFENILDFWMARGVDGFRIDVSRSLVKAEDLPDYPTEWLFHDDAAPDGRRTPMFDQDEVHDVYRGWRSLMDRVGVATGADRMAVGEAHVRPAARLARYVRSDELHHTFNFDFLKSPFDAAAVRGIVDEHLAANDEVGAVTAWVQGNHDEVRLAGRLGLPDGADWADGIGPDDPQPDAAKGLRRARTMAAIMLALPGAAYVYQGDELGLPEHTTLDPADRRDPTWEASGHTAPGRDGCRIPLPWQAGAPACGFSSTGRTWLPQPMGWETFAVDAEESDPDSTLALYRRALSVRRERGLGLGALTWESDAAAAASGLLVFRVGSVRVAANFSSEPAPMPLGDVLLATGSATDELPPENCCWTAAD